MLTKKEFAIESKKLTDCYPQQFNAVRMEAIYHEVKDLDASWWAKTVRHILLAGDPRANIGEAARAYRHAKTSVRLADDEIKRSQQMSDRGLTKALDAFGANSLLEAFEKRRTKPCS